MHDRSWIAAHIPHQGRMCLLDEVRCWDAEAVTCASSSHRAADHPLRAHGRLGAACAIEYAAQAVAVHGALLRGSAPTAGSFGMLTSARSVQLHVERLDDLPGELLVQARQLHSDGRSALYDFAIRHAGTLLAEGRAGLLLERPGTATG